MFTVYLWVLGKTLSSITKTDIIHDPDDEEDEEDDVDMQTREERDLAEEDNDFGDVFKSDNDLIGLRNIVADIAKYSDIRKANTDLTTDGRLIPEKDLVNYNEYLLNNNGPNATTAS